MLTFKGKFFRKTKLLKLVDRLPGTIFQYRQWENGRCTFPYSTQDIEKIFFTTPAELAKDGQKAWDKICPDSITPVREALKKSAENLTEFENTFSIHSPQGGILWVQARAVPERMGDSSTLWHGYMEDVTARHAAEDAAKQKAALLNVIFENMPDQIYYMDRESRLLGVNPACCRHHKKTAEEMIGKTDIELYPTGIGKQLYDEEMAMMADGQPLRETEQHMNDDGSFVYLESIKCPLKSASGQIIGLAGISRDITWQAENERKLIEACKEADAANKAKSSFLAMMSHEIRTPMNGVIGAASLLTETGLSSQQKELVNTIQVCGENLLTILNDILDYTKIETGKIVLEKEPFDLRECIEYAFDLFVQVAAKKNIELLFYIDPGVPKTLIGDAIRLRQILVNLIDNAIKFTETGEVALKIHSLIFDEKLRQYQIEFAVRDTGIGIAKENRSSLFQPFIQADTSSTRKYGGTGLGLAISRKLAELMGGKIWFESEMGKGTTFFFTVTLTGTDHAPRKTNHWPVEALRGKRVLIVDDNTTNCWLLSDQLAQWGLISKTFEDPAAALSHLRDSQTYDIALIDFQMPGMNGFELAKQIYGMKKEPQLPVIILSSCYENIPADPSISARLSKPVKVSKLCTLILQTLAEQKTLSDRKEEPGGRPAKARNLRILVAEDNDMNQQIIQAMLQRLGYNQTDVVSDGEEAVAAAMNIAYDVILMDIQMPRMDGLEASRRIHAYTGQPDKPWIIAVTGGLMQEEQSAIEEAGLNGFLAKPLTVRQLEKTLDDLHLS